MWIMKLLLLLLLVTYGDSSSVQKVPLLGYVSGDDYDSVRNLTSPTVINIKKCCWNGTYDTESHICRGNTDGQEILQLPFLRDTECFVNVEFGLSKCDASEAVVSVVVSSDETELLTNGSLVVNTRNEMLTLKNNTFCVDSVVNSSDSVVVKFCQSARKACAESPCVQKCCPVGESMIGSSSCKPSDFDFNPQFYNAVATDNGYKHVKTAVPSFAILSNLNCEKHILEPDETGQDVSYLKSDGTLYVSGDSDDFITTDKYCLEKVYIPEKDMDGIYTFLCFAQEEQDRSFLFILCPIGVIISSFFLLVTFLVYACLPSLQNLHGKTLMCYVASLFAAYVCLSVVQLGSVELELTFCVDLGYTMLFFFLAAFSWLNVMCFDIWWTFGAMRLVGYGASSRRQREWRRFISYSIYAWGLPIALTVGTRAVDKYKLTPPAFRPDMGDTSCWFSNLTHGKAVFFLGPVSPIFICNLVLFVLTARHCSKVKAEIHRMQQNSIGDRCKRRYHADKKKFVMNAKLFVVMGVTWSLEILSSFLTEPFWIWYLPDAANALQGVLIFCIFVLKPKVFRTLAHRIGLPNLGRRTRTNNTDIPTTCYDPYHIRKTSSTLTLSTAITDSRHDRVLSESCK